MDIEIKKLSSDLVDDYVDFFENRAFCNGSEFTGCYCVWYHWTDELENERNRNPEDIRKCFKRNLAIELIKKRKLKDFWRTQIKKLLDGVMQI